MKKPCKQPSAHGWPRRDLGRVLLTEQALRRRVKELGEAISRDHAGEPLTLVCILKGSVIFLADLLRAVSVPCAVDFIAVTSYDGTRRASAPRVTLDLRENPAGKNVLLVEDIVDTGLTLAYLKNLLLSRRVKSLKTCALLDKPARRLAPVDLDYRGFTIPDEFVVGYGLDCAERYRNLPYIAVLRRTIPQGKRNP